MAARVIWQILVDATPRRQAQKRGGAAGKITRDTSVLSEDEPTMESFRVEEALEKMAPLEPELADLVALRLYAGLTVKECAAALGVSPRTVDRRWFAARALLRLILSVD